MCELCISNNAISYCFLTQCKFPVSISISCTTGYLLCSRLTRRFYIILYFEEGGKIIVHENDASDIAFVYLFEQTESSGYSEMIIKRAIDRPEEFHVR